MATATGAATRERVVAEAVRRFGTDGFSATSLDDVAGGAGIRKQSLLYHFPSKEDLLEAAALHAAAVVFETLDGALRHDDPGGLDRLDALVSAVHALANERTDVIGLIREVARVGPPLSDRVASALQPLVDAAAQWLQAAMDAGEVRRQDPRSALLTIYSAVVGHLTESSVRRVLAGESSSETTQSELVSFLRAALAPDPKLPDIRCATFVRAEPAAVYELFTTGIDRWFTTGAEVDPVEGGAIVWRWRDWGPDRVTAEARGTVLAAEPGRRFAFRWGEQEGEYATTVEVTFEQRDDCTVVRVRDFGYRPTPMGAEALMECAAGWGEALTLLKHCAESCIS
ncbi:MAG TPA: SRPBCC domain-containing protein [Actinomycetota bacterium]|nr:SRPBCC domain-containing protein [Actinomycetota bacterium]